METKKIPVLIAGMWPAQEGDPESGSRILIQDYLGEKKLITGFSDAHGQFKGQIPFELADQDVRIVIVEPSFIFDDYRSVRVIRWGLFLPIRQQKDNVYSGTKGAKTIDFERWNKWNSNEEHSKASQITHAAARKAELTWPLNTTGYVIAFFIGVGGFYIHPVVGVFLGIGAVWLTNFLSQFLLTKGF